MFYHFRLHIMLECLTIFLLDKGKINSGLCTWRSLQATICVRNLSYRQLTAETLQVNLAIHLH